MSGSPLRRWRRADTVAGAATCAVTFGGRAPFCEMSGMVVTSEVPRDGPLGPAHRRLDDVHARGDRLVGLENDMRAGGLRRLATRDEIRAVHPQQADVLDAVD